MAPSLAAVLLLLLLLLFTATTTAAFTVKLIPRESLRPNNLTQTQHLERLIQHSKIYALSRYGRSYLLRPRMIEKRMFYLVNATIGTGTGDGQVLSALHFDLGSDYTWIQCLPCNHCFRHPSLTFNPPHSTTFHVIKRDDPLCILLAGSNRPDGPYCGYVVQYVDGTSTTGLLSRDRFTFDSDSRNGGSSIYQGIAFGCSTSSNFPEDDTGEWDGIIGMGQGPVSIVSQLGSVINHRFSYCLVKPESGLASFLTFGQQPQRDYDTTPILSFHGSGNYFLTLEDISIGNNRLNLPVNTFRRNGHNDGGFVVDTGTPFTHLITPAYAAVKNAVMGILDGLHLQRVEERNEELCYMNTAHPEAILPGMVFHFQGADYKMPWDNVFVVDGRIVCLGVLENHSVSLFGARMMANHRFSFNLKDHVLSFVPEVCGDA